MGRRTVLRAAAVLTAALLVGATACSGDADDPAAAGGEATAPAPTAPPPPEATPLDESSSLITLSEITAARPGCDVLDQTACLLPFPSDHFTVDDATAATGRRVAFPVDAMPTNAAGTPIDPSAWDLQDGFSPGTPIITHLPGIWQATPIPDLAASGAPTQGDIARSLDDDSPIVVVDLDTGERVPLWAELDADAEGDEDRLLIIRPARNLEEGHRHGVAIRDLVGTDGAPIEPWLGFTTYRDNLTTVTSGGDGIPEIEDRRPAMEALFADLHLAGIERSDLQLAWDFTVASEENLAGPLLAMRDDALEAIGDGAPDFTVTEVRTDDLGDGIDRIVEGTFEVPSYLSGDGGPGSVRNDTDGDGLPERNGTVTALFTCQVPTASLDEPARPVVYGHGLLGSRGEVRSGHVARTAAGANLVYCATDWWGMSENDLITVAGILGDLSGFAKLADRSLQGILNTVVLGRLVRADDGLASDPAFQGDDGARLITTGEAYFDGNSQGGIMGGAATAVSTEWERAVLGVPGMNYATLLRRSVDFEGKPGSIGFADVLLPAYPSSVDRNIGFGLIQMLWDRAETNGYAHHLTDDPLPDTPGHTVILHVAFGDHQVANVTAEVLARTAGMGLRWPALDDGRHPDAAPFAELERVEGFPTDRSLLVYWDSGTLAPPLGPITPVQTEAWVEDCTDRPDAVPCLDPHEDPRRQDEAIAQKDAFFRPDGEIIDPCDGRPCAAVPRSVSGR